MDLRVVNLILYILKALHISNSFRDEHNPDAQPTLVNIVSENPDYEDPPFNIWIDHRLRVRVQVNLNLFYI